MLKAKNRLLALLLSLAMLFSTLPAAALATEVEPETDAATVETVDDADAAEEATDTTADETEETATENVAEVTDEANTEEAAEESVADEATEEVAEVAEEAASEDDISVASEVAAADDSTTVTEDTTRNNKPADGTTTGQPFSSGTGGSSNFRIPAMVTLDDGTIVAACDARWNTTSDGWCLDTIVSYSKDNGTTWNYTFANYLGDNGNSYNSSSTAFIDPCLATDGETVWMLVDLYPGGTAIGSAQAGTGYDSNGHLLLSSNSGSSYDYYVGDYTDGYASIYTVSGDTAIDHYTVDEYFYLYYDGTCISNVFFSDCTYTVLPTSYLYLTTSTDGGATWSAPTMLNAQVKNSDDEFYGVGPGSGLVTSTGRIIFSCYTYVTSDGNTSVIYSDDGGKTWTRSADMSDQSSEATMVEADGTIYMFTRHGGYYYSTDNGTTWSSRQTVSGISYTTSCQINAMVYSEKIDGCTAILLSAPTSNRTTGKIFVGLVQDDGSINWAYTYSVNGSNTYQYSCLAELSNGTVALLYESGSAAITYTTLDIADIASGAEIGSSETTVTDEATGISATADGLTSISVTKGDATTNDDGSVSIAYDITLNDGAYTGAATVTIPVDEAFANCDNFSAVVYNDDSSDTDTVGVTVSGSNLILSVPHFSTVLVTGTTSGTTTVTETKDVTVYVGYTTTITDETGNYESVYNASGLDTGIASVTVSGTTTEASSTTTYSGTKVTSATSGSTYYVGDGTNYLVLSGSSLSTTTDITQATAFTWTESSTSTGGPSNTSRYLSSGSYYLRYNNSTWSATTSTSGSQSRTNFSSYSGSLTTSGGSGGSGSTNTGYSLYTMTETTETVEGVDTTTIAITGVAVGTTSVVVGNTQYNIIVEEAPAYVDVTTSPFTSGQGAGDGSVVTKLTISKTLSYDLDLSISGSTIVWSSGDESIATVDQNGTVTGVSAGETTITVTVDGVPYTIPVVVRDDGVSYTSTLKTYDFYVSEITDTTAYMGILYGTTNSNVESLEFVEVQEGEAIYIAFEQNAGTAVDFFASPDEGYALTRMSSTNSAGDYYAIDTDTPSTTAFYLDTKTDGSSTSAGAGANQRTAFGNSIVQAIIQKAIDLECDGAMGFTRASGSTGNCSSTLVFRSQKLPTVEKEITSVNGVAYTEGMTAQAGDVITFTVTVTQYATTEEIVYSDEVLTDNLSGATFTASNSNTTTPTLSDSTLSSNVVTTYTVTYTITDDDLDTTITNTVDLTYTYKSKYSNGSFGGSANAEASFVATSFQGVDLVVDFGLPVSYTYAAWGKDSVILESTGSASYGTVAVTGNRTNGWTVTYTPNTVLMGVDTVTMTSTTGATYTFKVYPATTVYYEEGFATYGTGWSVTSGGGWSDTTNTGKNSQETEIANTANNSYNNYNYDGAYKTDTTGSEGTAASTTTAADSLSFTFTGTGVDIFANCDKNSGVVGIKVTDSNDSVKKTLTVDMADTGAYASGGTAYNTPISSISGLTHGTYTVTIYLGMVESSGFKFDGFRVYGTIDESSDSATSAVYAADLEDNPSYYELRNYVLGTLVADTTSSTYADDIANGVAQVYATNEVDKTNSAIVVYSTGSGIVETADGNILDNGPKNELYLDSGASVAFKINTTREVQIGLRSVTGASVTYTISDGSTTNTYTTNSSVDMFYTLQAKGTGEKTYTISVTSGGILSITDIKVSDSNDESIFGSLTADEVVAALTGETAGAETADAALTVDLADYTGSVIASTQLTATGVAGESATFAASDILSAVSEALPDGYALVDEDSAADQTVTYGENATLTLQIGKVATLTVTYQKYSGLFKKTTVGTVTLTKVRTSSTGKATFSASEIKAAVPSGYKVLVATSASVSYGSAATKTVTVY